MVKHRICTLHFVVILGIIAAAFAPVVIVLGWLIKGLSLIAPLLAGLFSGPVLAGIVAFAGLLTILIAKWDSFISKVRAFGRWLGIIPKNAEMWLKFIPKDIPVTLAPSHKKTQLASSYIGNQLAASHNQTEVAIKVTAEEGSTATIEKVHNKKGKAKVKVTSEGYIGRTVLAGAGL